MAVDKYYVVWEGLKPGIYRTWKECEAQIKGFTNAKYKSFASSQEAEIAYKSSYYSYFKKKTPNTISHLYNSLPANVEKPIIPSVCVDASCIGNPGLMEYRGVDTASGKEIFKAGPFKNGTNNIGEFLSIVHCLALLNKNNIKTIIYSDSITAMNWIKAKKHKSKLKKNEDNKEIFELLDRAVLWLNNNGYNCEIRKWNTELWGEIFADYNRK
ncbi:MAG: ribonuclease H family protein [Bacteroidales bacterium]|nr:ribonuclease H family protein [Bacteroidales bacterium]